MTDIIELENKFNAPNYQPLPVVLTKGQGIYVWDEQGKRYIDMMSAYSAVSHGHCHPRLVAALTKQAQQLTMVSRAYYTDKLALLVQKLCLLFKQDMALLMNSGAEAVETALKVARRYAYRIKNIPKDKAEIIVCQNNFHGRTISIVSMSSEPDYKQDFGPLTPGFKIIPYGDSAALAAAITPNTAAFLVEPIQGEGGIIVPPAGYLQACAKICRQHKVLLLCDEIQSGLGRTGKWLASDHEGVQPDGLILGKALGGGMLPVSAFLTRREIMELMTPGSHGSTFGGNPLACAVALESLAVLEEEELITNAARMGEYFFAELKALQSSLITAVRGKGLWFGLEINPQITSAKQICLDLLSLGILSKETHHTVVRLAPPLIINQEQLEQTLSHIKTVVQKY